jgi:MurNAc alpha-1-phosphate uridylyltransferase
MTSALILVAGRGERLRPLTDTTPKPLVPDAAGTPLLAHWLERLADAGIGSVVLNPCWLGEQIEQYVGDGSAWRITVQYSRETPPGLETAGGIRTALPLIDSDPFLVVNGDVDLAPAWSLAMFVRRGEAQLNTHPDHLGYLLLAPNPPDHRDGDFTVTPSGALLPHADTTRGNTYTFAGVALYRSALLTSLTPQTRAPLGPLLRQAITEGRIGYEITDAPWWDIGTPQRLARWRRERQALIDSTKGDP